MLKIENYEVVGWEHVIRGMRNPKNSWDKSDSNCDAFYVGIGPNDHKLMTSLAKGGPVHAKYRRMITVYLDITAPLYWWKEFDTYKVGTVANSCSTMHKIHDKEFTMDDFSTEHLMRAGTVPDPDLDIPFVDVSPYITETGGILYSPMGLLVTTIDMLNECRNKFLEAKTKPMKEESKRAGLMKQYWWQMIQLLPTSYNQKRTVMLNYEVLHNIYFSRKDHKLDEWHTLCDWIKTLPYSEFITMEESV